MSCSTSIIILACIAGLVDLSAFALLIGCLQVTRIQKEKSSTETPTNNQPEAKPFSESALARLPLELRLLIFKHYFRAHTYLLDPLTEFRRPVRLPPPPLPANHYHSTITNLLLTCSQIYHEAAPLALANTTFKTFLRYESIYDFLQAPPLSPNGKLQHLIIHYRRMWNTRLAPLVRNLPDLESVVICGDTQVLQRDEFPGRYNRALHTFVTDMEFIRILNRRAPLDICTEQGLQAVLKLARKPVVIELVFHVGSMNNGDVVVYWPVEGRWVRKRLDVVTQVQYGFDEGRYHVPYGRVRR